MFLPLSNDALAQESSANAQQQITQLLVDGKPITDRDQIIKYFETNRVSRDNSFLLGNAFYNASSFDFISFAKSSNPAVRVAIEWQLVQSLAVAHARLTNTRSTQLTSLEKEVTNRFVDHLEVEFNQKLPKEVRECFSKISYEHGRFCRTREAFDAMQQNPQSKVLALDELPFRIEREEELEPEDGSLYAIDRFGDTDMIVFQTERGPKLTCQLSAPD